MSNHALSVGFGRGNFSTGLTYLPEHGFRGWYNGAHIFTATAETQILRFAAVGPFAGPPIAPIIGLNLTSQNEPPVPPAATPGPLQLLGLAASFAWSRRLRKRINQGVKP